MNIHLWRSIGLIMLAVLSCTAPTSTSGEGEGEEGEGEEGEGEEGEGEEGEGEPGPPVCGEVRPPQSQCNIVSQGCFTGGGRFLEEQAQVDEFVSRHLSEGYTAYTRIDVITDEITDLSAFLALSFEVDSLDIEETTLRELRLINIKPRNLRVAYNVALESIAIETHNPSWT